MNKERIHNHLYSIIELAKDSAKEGNADNIKTNALCILHDITLIISEIEGKDMYGRILPQPTSEKCWYETKPKSHTPNPT